MAGNTGYQIAGGSQTVTLPAYTAFGTEVGLQKSWSNIWLRKMPMLAMIHSGAAHWNKGSDINGTQMLVPIMLADQTTPAAGVTIANTLTAMTPFATNGFTQASYLVGHYRGGYWVSAEEKRKINNARGNFLQGKLDQMTGSFQNAIAADVSSANADAENAALGIQQVLSTSNTVGGISQSSNSDWQANVSTGVGLFTLDVLDAGIDVVDNRGGKVDFIFMAYSSTNNLFSKLRAALAPAERLVNQEFSAKYGYTNIQYLNATCISDGRLTAGVICGVDSSTWFYRGDEMPQLDHVAPLTGTDATEHVYAMFVGVGCGNPAYNFRDTGVN